jgi:hypothetical protein
MLTELACRLVSQRQRDVIGTPSLPVFGVAPPISCDTHTKHDVLSSSCVTELATNVICASTQWSGGVFGILG